MEGLGFLRLRNISLVKLEIGNSYSPFRWVGFVSVSNAGLLPPEFRKGAGQGGSRSSTTQLVEAVVVVGSRGQVNGDLDRGLGPGTQFRISVPLDSATEVDTGHSHGGDAGQIPYQVFFEGELARIPPQVERQEFNRWMLRQVGALSYLPEDSIIFIVPQEKFQNLASLFHHLFSDSEGMHGGWEPPPYVPEMTHLIALDREALVSTWDLGGSLRRLEPEVQKIYQSAQVLTPFAWIRSDLIRLLTRMNEISRLISLATLLVAIPLLWMGWVLARWLGRLLVLDQRRLIGLALNCSAAGP